MKNEMLYLEAQQLLEDSWRLAARVANSGFRPSKLVALWRGGVSIGIAVQELLQFLDIPTQHCAIHSSSYSDIDRRSREIVIHGTEYLVSLCSSEDRLLIVDDVFDTGLTMDALIRRIEAEAGNRTPREIRIAVPWYKPARNRTGRVPDYYLHQTDRWLIFPHSLEGLERADIETNRPVLAAILEENGL